MLQQLQNGAGWRITVRLGLDSLHLLWTGTRQAIAGLTKDGYAISLIAAFFVLYLPQAIIITEDLGLITAFEVDAGSHMAAIDTVLSTYNMNAAYHSKFYGWTYFAINFLFLYPVHIILDIFSIETKQPLYFAIRILLFVIGLATVLSLYKLCRLTLQSRCLAALSGLLYILSPITSVYFYFVHPETTGLLFILLGCISLVHFQKEGCDPRYYALGLIAIFLSALSKQIYFFASVPLVAGFLIFYCRCQNRSLAKFILSLTFVRIAALSALLGLSVLLIVHPYAIIDFRAFLEYQSVLGGFVGGVNTLTASAALYEWMRELAFTPLIAMLPLLLTVVIIKLLPKINTNDRGLATLGLLCCGGVFGVLVLIVFLNRLVVKEIYLQPIYPFIALMFVATLKYSSSGSRPVQRAFAGSVLVLAVAHSAFMTGKDLVARLQYKDGVAYQTRQYILAHATRTDRIAYDHFVGMPQKKELSGCHYWQGCGTDTIEIYKPTVVMFDPSFLINGMPHAPTERLKLYVRDHGLKEVDRVAPVIVYRLREELTVPPAVIPPPQCNEVH